jgi:hypothetical protein
VDYDLEINWSDDTIVLSQQWPRESEDNYKFIPFIIAGITQNGIN